MSVYEWNWAEGIRHRPAASIWGLQKIVDRDGDKGLLITKTPCRETAPEP